MGSWTFICTQSFIFALWITINTLHPKGFDKYPFVFLNLIVGFQSALTAPILMIASNRQAEIDRKRLLDDLELDKKQDILLKEMHSHFDTHFHELISKIEKNN
jgi:uncharacterized membrane protein